MYPRSEDVDPFIGERFGEAGHLEVVGWGDRRGDVRRYKVVCHTCAKDGELYGDAIYLIAKGDLKAGTKPCGCSKIPKWTRKQYLVKIRRLCESKNLVLITEPNFINHNTNLDLMCNICGGVWNSTRTSRFLLGSGCIHCQKVKVSEVMTKGDDETNAKFKATGAYPNVDRFYRSSRLNSRGYPNYWQYKCNICSNDEYVQAGLCTGIFEAGHSHILKGKISCRCATNYKWTAQQREYQIKKALAVCDKYSFVGWVNGHKNNVSKFICNCTEHGNWTASCVSVVDMNRTCPDCAPSGYKRYLPAHFYVLRIMGRHGSFTGYGITTSLETRMAKHKYNLKSYGFEITESTFIEMSGEQALEVEKIVKRKFTIFGQEPEGFRTEATYYENYQAVCDFVDKWLFENPQQF